MTSVVGVRPPPNEHLTSFAPALLTGCGALAWVATGRAVAVPIVSIGMVSAAAGVIDARTGRIPNRVVLIGVVAFVAGAVVTGLGDHRSVAELITAAVLGVVVSGAPFLVGVWLVRPAGLGAGDVKLLTLQGAAIGLLAPLAAVFLLLGGWVVGGGVMLLRRRRDSPMAPGFAVGFAAAAVGGAAANTLLGGVYG